MATAPKKNGAILVVRNRKTVALPVCQLGSFPKLFEPDDYDPAKPKFKARFHYNPQGLTALAALLQRTIDRHWEEMYKLATESKLPIVQEKRLCQSPGDFLEGKLKDPHEKDRIQLPKIELSVPYLLPPKKGETEGTPREIKFWDRSNNLIENPKEVLRRMTSGTWVEPIVHDNLFLSKQLGKDPRPQLQLVGLRIVKLVEYGSGQEQAPDSSDDDAMAAIMGADFDPDDMGALGQAAPGGEAAEEEDMF